MKGFKTIIFNLLLALLAVILPALSDFNWEAFVSPSLALGIAAAINIALRFITNTGVGQKE